MGRALLSAADVNGVRAIISTPPSPFWEQVSDMPRFIAARHNGIVSLLADLDHGRAEAPALPVRTRAVSRRRRESGRRWKSLHQAYARMQ